MPTNFGHLKYKYPTQMHLNFHKNEASLFVNIFCTHILQNVVHVDHITAWRMTNVRPDKQQLDSQFGRLLKGSLMLQSGIIYDTDQKILFNQAGILW